MGKAGAGLVLRTLACLSVHLVFSFATACQNVFLFIPLPIGLPRCVFAQLFVGFATENPKNSIVRCGLSKLRLSGCALPWWLVGIVLQSLVLEGFFKV